WKAHPGPNPPRLESRDQKSNRQLPALRTRANARLSSHDRAAPNLLRSSRNVPLMVRQRAKGPPLALSPPLVRLLATPRQSPWPPSKHSRLQFRALHPMEEETAEANPARANHTNYRRSQ